MIAIQIYLITDEQENLTRLGIRKPSTRELTTTLNLRTDQVLGYWVDPEDGDIVLYTGSDTFLCHHSEDLVNKLEACMANEERRLWALSFPTPSIKLL